jgi:hypothetical protein
MSQMKKVIIVLALVFGFTSNAQEVVYTDSDCPITIMDDGKMLVQMSNGKQVFYDFGTLENVSQMFENIKTGTSTEQYTVTPYMMGTMKLVFKDYQWKSLTIVNKTEYYITPYLRKEITKAIKNSLTN